MDKIGSFLETNFSEIEKQRSLGKIVWLDVAREIFQQTGQHIDKEALRSKFTRLRKKNQIEFKDSEEEISKQFDFKENTTQGTAELRFTADHPPTEQEIIQWFKIDRLKYRINQIYHKTSFGGKYAITVSLLALKGVETLTVNDEFLKGIALIKQLAEVKNLHKSNKKRACLIIPKQDAHWNKSDISGNNSIEERFANFTQILLSQLSEDILPTRRLDKVIYIIGSDEFNAEWTGSTTKGTPQSNIMSYQQSFEKICKFNIDTIHMLATYADSIDVILLSGNHDHNVGWHLAHILQTVFSNSTQINVDAGLECTKIVGYDKNLLMFNHGDAVKPKDLAAKFPIMANNIWSNYTNFYVITGDKHHEVSHDFNGIIWYQVPQLSKAVSVWDDKMGFRTSAPEVMNFLFSEGKRNIRILKDVI